MTVVLKLGGSVVTEKDEPETVDEEALSTAVDAIADWGEPLVVVHGGGSFGHYHAERHGVGVEQGTRNAGVAAAIHDAMVELNDAVVAALQERGVPALPVHPLSVASRSVDGDLHFPTDATETMLTEGFVPVLHGDVIATGGEGVTVLSGDEIVVVLATAIGASRVGLCSGVPGVLDGDDAVIEQISALDEVADAVGESDATDVTGGMAAKVEALLELGIPAQIFGPADLARFLAGERPGTTIQRADDEVS